MTRDYAKKSPPPKKKRAPLPPWLWMLTGLLVGLFVAFLVFITQQKGDSPVAPKVAAVAPAKPKPAPKPTPQPEPPKEEGVKFDFYKILPEYEVVISDEEVKAGGESASNKPSSYILQAGSFRTTKDADTRRAQLALLGIKSHIQTVTVDGKDTWHRVQAGPYTDRRELDRAKRLLLDNNIDAIILKSNS